MTTRLKIGFIALCDAASLIVARERGFFAEEGLNVELTREPSWANIRDKVAYGVLDAAHMLAPMLLECTLGAGNVHKPLQTSVALNAGGGGITLSGQPRPGEKVTMAMVYPFSSHHYALRRFLEDQHLTGELMVVPPAQMIAALAARKINGFCVGAPWGQLAERLDLGRHREAEPVHRMEKVLGTTKDWAASHPAENAALVRAIRAAGQWTNAPENRQEVAEILAAPGYLNAPADVIADGLKIVDFSASRPSLADAAHFLSEMRHFGQIGTLEKEADLITGVFRADLYDLSISQASASLSPLN